MRLPVVHDFSKTYTDDCAEHRTQSPALQDSSRQHTRVLMAAPLLLAFATHAMACVAVGLLLTSRQFLF